MCGISGFNWRDESKVKEMVSVLSYRGPDAQDIFLGDGISLGHNRLSIIDLSPSANQPMFDTDRDLALVYNGEIYNFRELRKELKGEYSFKTKSDSEVILAGYRKWGDGVFDKLNGMFTLAIWDKRDKSLTCARDSVGMKPLYYYWDKDKFIFASEPRALYVHDIKRRLDRVALNHFLRIQYTPEPMTLVENVYKLTPGHVLKLQKNNLSIRPYTRSFNKKMDVSYEEATGILRDKVLKSVERHLISDVPLGVYLSGGIDSSIILSAASKFRKQIKSFSVGFSGVDDKFNEDLNLAKKTAEHFGSEHKFVLISAHDALGMFEDMSLHNSDPISNPTSLAMLILARFAKKDVSVVLTGSAGDELFGGYGRYQKALLARLLYKPDDLFAKFMFEKDDKLNRVLSTNVFIPSVDIKKYYEKYLIGSDSADSLMNTDRQSWLPDHFFMLSDKMSMSNALEERMPLADKNLIEFATSLPRKYKVGLRGTKKILKDAFRKDLPEYLFDQPKRGWFSPAAKWFRVPEFADFARKILSPDYYSPSEKLFNWPKIRKMLEDHIEKREYNLTILWAIMTFQVWAKQYQIEI